jgi:hypothetical protein
MMSRTAKAVAMALTKGGCLGKFKSSDFFFFASFPGRRICRLGTKSYPPKDARFQCSTPDDSNGLRDPSGFIGGVYDDAGYSGD